MRKRARKVERVKHSPLRREALKSFREDATYISAYDRGGLRRMWASMARDRWLRIEFGPAKRRRVVFVRVARGDHGEVICTGVLLGGEGPIPVTARGLREVPIVHLLAQARTDPAALEWWTKQGLATKVPRLSVGRPGPKGHPRAHFEEVAAAYRRAVEIDRKPIQRLRKEFRTPEGRETPEQTIRRWIQRCRDMGLLGASTPGRAGEKERSDQ